MPNLLRASNILMVPIVTFTPLKRGRYRANGHTDANGRPVILKKSQLDNFRNQQFSRLHPRTKLPPITRIYTPPRPKLRPGLHYMDEPEIKPKETLNATMFSWQSNVECPSCLRWLYPGDFDTLMECQNCKARVRINRA